MAPVINGRHIFNEIPTGYPVPGQTTLYDASQTIDLENVPLQGGFLVKTLILSIDPYMRVHMKDTAIQSYILGQPLSNYGIGTVLHSENPAFQAGDHIYGMLPFEEYWVQTQAEGFNKLDNKYNLPWSTFIGAAGLPGLTAYGAWKEYAQAKKIRTFITSGASAVGSLIIQLAKCDGLKVIASAGSAEKVAFMKEIGADVVFNYKTTKMSEVLAKEGPIDIYWDNVGGEALEAAFASAKMYARFIECGMISEYNAKPYPVMNLMSIVTKEIKLYSFVVLSLLSKYQDAFYKEVPELIASGKLKLKEDLTRGLENVGEAILAVQTGTGKGKGAIIVADK